uniref:DUF1618 domain-containing protein n=1 Tax=Oryza glumipatula TaxID=40148 RepID=A0A0D9Y466_9ORYZ
MELEWSADNGFHGGDGVAGGAVHETPSPSSPTHLTTRIWLGSIGEISSTHNGIVVIYAHQYNLLYDASINHLTAIPPLPHSITSPRIFLPLGRSAVIAAAADDYIFADIVTSSRTRLLEATIFAWVKNGGEWIQSLIAQLPLPTHLCGPT